MVGGRVKTASAGLFAAATLVISGCGGPATEASSGAPSVSSSTIAGSTQDHDEADVMFAQSMIPHHEQAIEMSDSILGKQGIDPRVIDIATEIKAAQAPEIEQMQSWLDEWGTPEQDMSDMPHGDMPMDGQDMMGEGMMGEGMMSDDDMAALEDAQGVDASRLFLTQMIAHHKGAITMAQREIDNGRFPAAVELARSIVTTQQAEITTMQGVLDTL